MSLEGGSEKAPIELTQEELDVVSALGIAGNDDEKARAIMADKGIKMDTGTVDIMVDGVLKKMVTDEGDFGTTHTEGPAPEEEVTPTE